MDENEKDVPLHVRRTANSLDELNHRVEEMKIGLRIVVVLLAIVAVILFAVLRKLP